jgi:hypothetical protein
MQETKRGISSNSLPGMILRLLLQDPSAVLDLLFDLFQRIPIFKSLPGMYEVLDYEARLELKDGKGKTAVYSKHQLVRFLQDHIIAYQDIAWGDGDIFADYKCSPGVEVDRYREGHRYNILISLRETKQRGDETTFRIERTIRNGFTQKVEQFQTEIDNRTNKLSLSVISPRSRLPVKVDLIELNTRRTSTLDREHHQVLPDGRHKYIWKTSSPRLYEAYILRWGW